MTEEHNKYRTFHSAPGLALSAVLSKDSQWYANQLASRGSVAHSPMKSRQNIGESIEKLCTKNGGMPTASEVLKKWLVSSYFDPVYDIAVRNDTNKQESKY